MSLTSKLMTYPKKTIMNAGTRNAIPRLRRSRRSGMTSFRATARSRIRLGIRSSPHHRAALATHQRDEHVLERRPDRLDAAAGETAGTEEPGDARRRGGRVRHHHVHRAT